MLSTHRKMYRIDDIDFNKTPESRFGKNVENGNNGNGSSRSSSHEMTYAEYYERHGGRITDWRQPMLTSNPKKKEFHRGERDTIYLIPELCFMTGFNDEMRRDFSLMTEVTKITHQEPGRKINEIQQFMQRLRNTPEVSVIYAL